MLLLFIMSEPSSSIPDGHSRPGNSSSDEDLIIKVQGGEASSFDQLIERYKGRLYGVLYNMLGNHEDAADLSQEVFLKAFKSINKFRSDSNFYTWLYRIGINTGLNYIKKRKEAPLSLNPWNPEVEEDPALKELASKESVGGALDMEELRERLNESLQKLSEEHRAVVVLHDIEGMRHQEIAKVLGCSEATARSRLFYAHQQLQGLLAKYI
jgi:RNA polymerase sigma factor (sigma-70 family)